MHRSRPIERQVQGVRKIMADIISEMGTDSEVNKKRTRSEFSSVSEADTSVNSTPAKNPKKHKTRKRSKTKKTQRKERKNQKMPL